ncbi:hypothetical protein G5I_01878 [Acromyrmex echinatior]|uniref:Uncharacterized protein n=1 Tax=Acromyrmex echinatior TaxID=103372 RepID=F4W8U1_ACREC|nr:hypothetical protein G5I_01878 [Acromyrmex echinatior]
MVLIGLSSPYYMMGNCPPKTEINDEAVRQTSEKEVVEACVCQKRAFLAWAVRWTVINNPVLGDSPPDPFGAHGLDDKTLLSISQGSMIESLGQLFEAQGDSTISLNTVGRVRQEGPHSNRGHGMTAAANDSTGQSGFVGDYTPYKPTSNPNPNPNPYPYPSKACVWRRK